MRTDKWRISRGLAAGILGFALIIAVAACGKGQADVVLPRKPAHAQLAGIVPAPPSTRQVIVAAYENYWQATNQAVDSHNLATAKTILAAVVPPGVVPGLLKGMQALWQRDEMAFGAPVFHIVSVKITGSGTAAVHDCIDLSHTGFQNRKTGQIAGGLGQSHDYLITTLALEHGRWLVTGAFPVVQACSY
jgi:hypothetical protein